MKAPPAGWQVCCGTLHPMNTTTTTPTSRANTPQMLPPLHTNLHPALPPLPQQLHNRTVHVRQHPQQPKVVHLTNECLTTNSPDSGNESAESQVERTLTLAQALVVACLKCGRRLSTAASDKSSMLLRHAMQDLQQINGQLHNIEHVDNHQHADLAGVAYGNQQLHQMMELARTLTQMHEWTAGTVDAKCDTTTRQLIGWLRKVPTHLNSWAHNIRRTMCAADPTLRQRINDNMAAVLQLPATSVAFITDPNLRRQGTRELRLLTGISDSHLQQLHIHARDLLHSHIARHSTNSLHQQPAPLAELVSCLLQHHHDNNGRHQLLHTATDVLNGCNHTEHEEHLQDVARQLVDTWTNQLQHQPAAATDDTLHVVMLHRPGTEEVHPMLLLTGPLSNTSSPQTLTVLPAAAANHILTTGSPDGSLLDLGPADTYTDDLQDLLQALNTAVKTMPDNAPWDAGILIRHLEACLTAHTTND